MKRRPWPRLVESSGYSTRVSDSAAKVSATAPTKSPWLNSWKSNKSEVVAPETERVDGLAAKADDGPVIGDSDQFRGFSRNRMQAAATHFKRAVQGHFDFLPRPGDFPRIRAAQPIVGLLLLPAVVDGLFEDAVFIAKPIAHGRQRQRGHGIKKTRRQTSQPAIAQPGVRLLFEKL